MTFSISSLGVRFFTATSSAPAPAPAPNPPTAVVLGRELLTLAGITPAKGLPDVRIESRHATMAAALELLVHIDTSSVDGLHLCQSGAASQLGTAMYRDHVGGGRVQKKKVQSRASSGNPAPPAAGLVVGGPAFWSPDECRQGGISIAASDSKVVRQEHRSQGEEARQHEARRGRFCVPSPRSSPSPIVTCTLQGLQQKDSSPHLPPHAATRSG